MPSSALQAQRPPVSQHRRSQNAAPQTNHAPRQEEDPEAPQPFSHRSWPEHQTGRGQLDSAFSGPHLPRAKCSHAGDQALPPLMYSRSPPMSLSPRSPRYPPSIQDEAEVTLEGAVGTPDMQLPSMLDEDVACTQHNALPMVLDHQLP